MNGLRLLAFVLPLGLDLRGRRRARRRRELTARDRLRVSALLVMFEGGMPLIGGDGAPLARTISPVADYLADAALIGLGAWMLLAGGGEERRAARLKVTRGSRSSPWASTSA